MKFDYARVLTRELSLDTQIVRLEVCGYETIFSESASRGLERPVL